MLESFASLFSFDISPFVKDVSYKKGETIFFPGDESEKLIYIYTGSSRCSFIYPDGRCALLDYAPSPAFYGELELLSIQQYKSFVEAVTICKGYAIDTLHTKDKLLTDPVFLCHLASYIALKLFRVNKQMADNLNYPLKKRLASYILDKATDGIYSISHTDTSKYFATSYRHLLFVFKELEDEGIIEKRGRGKYIIKDLDLLKAEALDE